ncbi:MAG TPA: hypothetical protein VK158_04770 [Acidobacteriota bacterium]|nr:hypothetical protein [Acidobacteriota bacterium]
MPVITQDQLLALVREYGPVLPTDLTSRTGQNSMIIGAMLSTLIAEKKLKYTNAKWGGSPLYYTEEQTELIQKIYPHLNEKDRRAFDLLKAAQVLEDVEQTPLVRACLRSLKDFAIPLNVTTPDSTVLFWKWYLTPDAASQQLITNILAPRYAKNETASVKEASVKETVKETAAPKKETQVMPEAKSLQQKMTSDSRPQTPAPVAQKPAKKVVSPISPTQTSHMQTQNHMQSHQSPMPGYAHPLPVDEFLDELKGKLAEKDIVVISADIVKKKSELDLRIVVPTALGNVTYYAKAKKKKKSTEADLSQAVVKGQLVRLPAVYISYGELNKKANEMLKTDFAGLIVVQL